MTYRVYSGPRGSQSIAPAEKDRQLYKGVQRARRGYGLGAAP
jgi:hypothetical protein